jgi:hypothetical protein
MLHNFFLIILIINKKEHNVFIVRTNYLQLQIIVNNKLTKVALHSERNWSVFSYIHDKKHNYLTSEQVYCHFI